MRSKLPARVAILIASLVFGLSVDACVLKADGFTGGAPAGVNEADASLASCEAGATPPGVDASGGTASDAGDAATSPNLLENGDFELGCAAWASQFGFISAVTVGRNGGHACKFCMDTNFEAFLGTTVTHASTPGTTFVGEMWIKPATSGSALATAGYTGSSILIDTNVENQDTAGPVPLVDDWNHLTTLLVTRKSSGTLELDLRLTQRGNPASNGNVICVYVDDAAIRAR